MTLDVILFIFCAYACFRGWKKGLIWALGSLVAVVIGAMVSLQLGHHLANYLISNHWLVSSHTLLISFVMVFIIVMLVFSFLLSFLEQLMDLMFLGWVNKIGGAVLYVVFMAFVLSLVFWLSNNAGIISGHMKNQSKFYQRIKNFGPMVIKQASDHIPFCENIYYEADQFSHHISSEFK